MLVGSKTTKSLKNQLSGLDVCVPSVHEVEAPLGGITVEYEIEILTNLAIYKGQFHNEEDVVRYSVQRTYRELEDLHGKISKKFSNTSLPSIPKGRLTLQYTSEEKRAALDSFMQFFSANREMCQSSIFSNFIGINKLKLQKSVASSMAISQQSNEVSKSADSAGAGEGFSESENVDNAITTVESEMSGRNNDVSELFPKVKVRKSLTSESLPEIQANTDLVESLDSLLTGLNTPSILPDDDDDLDLFEEAKQVKAESKKEEKLFDSESKAHSGLFKEFEKDDILFSSPTVSEGKSKDVTPISKASAVKETSKERKYVDEEESDKENFGLFDAVPISSTEKKPMESGTARLKLQENTQANVLGDDDNSNRKGKVLLFQEQDLGSGITEDDEELFFIPKLDAKKVQANPFLSPTTENVEENEVKESLEELMNLSEPQVTFPTLVSNKEDPVLVKDESLPPKPVPKPRSRQLPPKTTPAPEKPQVAPRKVFMSKPSVPPKPVPTAKPVPPPKPKPSSKPMQKTRDTQLHAVEKLESKFAVNSVVSEKLENKTDDLSSFDIMQYIENEQKAASEGTSLFD